MKVLITGATGLIGKEIMKRCYQSGIDVNYLTTHKNKLNSEANCKGFYWNPSRGEIDMACFGDVEVIIHLVGATVAKRWNKKYKKEIISSRTISTAFLISSLKKQKHFIRQIVSASAIGIYPNSFKNYYKEDTNLINSGFLGEVTTKWEEAVLKFKDIGIDVGIVRIGLVLSEKGGAFPKIVKPIQYGLGAVLGNGEQWQSWIHIQDLVRFFMFIIEEELAGVFNAVAPNPVNNRKLTKVIAQKLNKDIVLPNIPNYIMKLFFGEMHSILYNSQRVSCAKIMQLGFEFDYDNINSAVDSLIK